MRAHSSAVAPVVRTSSTSNTVRPATSRRIGHRKSAAQVPAPLFAGISGLRFGGTVANQSLGRKIDPQMAQFPQGHPRDDLCLVEAPCALAGTVEGHRNQQKVFRSSRRAAVESPRPATFPGAARQDGRPGISKGGSVRGGHLRIHRRLPHSGTGATSPRNECRCVRTRLGNQFVATASTQRRGKWLDRVEAFRADRQS